VDINKAQQYHTDDTVTAVAESSARPGLRSADTAAYAKPRSLAASVASVLPVCSPGALLLHFA